MTLPFSALRKSATTTNNLNSDLKELSEWTFQWKMSFNPDPSKQEQEIIMSRKSVNPLSANPPAFGDELFESVWPFCGVGA